MIGQIGHDGCARSEICTRAHFGGVCSWYVGERVDLAAPRSRDPSSVRSGIRRGSVSEVVGTETVSARISAAEKLSQLLEADSQRRPATRRFIVAHSHGGTVALLGNAGGCAASDCGWRHLPLDAVPARSPPTLQRARMVDCDLGLVLSLAFVTIGAALITRSIVPLFLGPAIAWGPGGHEAKRASSSLVHRSRVPAEHDRLPPAHRPRSR